MHYLENENDNIEQNEKPSTSASSLLSSKMCENCLIEVPLAQWSKHLRSTSHKMKAAVVTQDGFKVTTESSLK